MYPGLRSGPGLEAVGTAELLRPSSPNGPELEQVTCPPGEKAEAHLSSNEFSGLVLGWETLMKSLHVPALPSPRPVLHIPILRHTTTRAEPSVKFSVNNSEMFLTLGLDGLGFGSQFHELLASYSLWDDHVQMI